MPVVNSCYRVRAVQSGSYRARAVRALFAAIEGRFRPLPSHSVYQFRAGVQGLATPAHTPTRATLCSIRIIHNCIWAVRADP